MLTHNFLKIVVIICTLIAAHSDAQDTILVANGDFSTRQTDASPVRMKAFAKDGISFLNSGIYKTLSRDPETIFAVGDSGCLQGNYITVSYPVKHTTVWNKGVWLRELVYEQGKLKEELFDSVVSVYLYDSVARNWKAAQRVARVRKTLSGYEGSWSLVFNGGPTYAYALLSYKDGKLAGENFPEYLHNIYNNKGELSFREVHNWKLKRVERTNYKDGVITSTSITTDKYLRWNNDGSVDYQTPGDMGEDREIVVYTGGKVVLREVYKNNKKTVIEYDSKGKIKSKTVVNIPTPDPNIAPVE